VARVNWYDVLPNQIACQQVAFERRAQVRRVHDSGVSQTSIASLLGVSRGRVRQLLYCDGDDKSPFDQWMDKKWSPVRALVHNGLRTISYIKE
jgi:predicted transcriptional regulator